MRKCPIGLDDPWRPESIIPEKAGSNFVSSGMTQLDPKTLPGESSQVSRRGPGGRLAGLWRDGRARDSPLAV